MGLRAFAAVAVLGALVALPSVARADVQHTVGRGHTIEAIANRYHVTAKAIIEANHLKDVKHLRVGEVLTIPGVKDKSDATTSKAKSHEAPKPTAEDRAANAAAERKPASSDTAGSSSRSDRKGEKVAKVGKTNGRETTTFAMKAKTPGVIHVHRIATTEQYDIHVGDKRGRVSPVALKTFEKMMRSPNGMAHPIEPRLVALLSVVSNHFGSRKIEVVSGFRPFTPTQFNPHSNHMHGKAIDFRVAGVPNEALRDFCRTLKNVGCGYYPNSVFVHMDVRDQSAFWIDYSKPGEAPRYNAPGLDADEGTNDVHDDGHPTTATDPTSDGATTTTTTTPSETTAPSVPTMPAAPGLTTPSAPTTPTPSADPPTAP